MGNRDIAWKSATVMRPKLRARSGRHKKTKLRISSLCVTQPTSLVPDAQ